MHQFIETHPEESNKKLQELMSEKQETESKSKPMAILILAWLFLAGAVGVNLLSEMIFMRGLLFKFFFILLYGSLFGVVFFSSLFGMETFNRRDQG
ncbi:MAG: hypothetical protein ACOC44_11435 [Promethearchaeia archaeon]